MGAKPALTKPDQACIWSCGNLRGVGSGGALYRLAGLAFRRSATPAASKILNRKWKGLIADATRPPTDKPRHRVRRSGLDLILRFAYEEELGTVGEQHPQRVLTMPP